MRTRIALIIMLVSLPLAGCNPSGKALASLQYHNIHLRLAKTRMTMSTGDGSVDARKLMDRETYAGEVKSGRVTVEYPEGLEETARDLATSFDAFYPVIKERLGIDWSFDILLRLVRVQPGAGGYRYSVVLPRSRRVVFPVPVLRDSPDGEWVPVIAHELTEASLIAPKKRAGLVMSDLYSGPFCLSMDTRWFRDGLGDYAEHQFDSRWRGVLEVPPARVYAQLNQVRDGLLSWSNCAEEPWLYDAASGLIYEMRNRFGADAVSRMMNELRKEEAPDGRALLRAFRRATGTDLREFLESYQTPWAGFVVTDVSGRVVVGTVYPATPASRRGIGVGDVIVSFAGVTVRSSNELMDLMALQKVGGMVSVEIDRGGEPMSMRLKLIAMPQVLPRPPS